MEPAPCGEDAWQPQHTPLISCEEAAACSSAFFWEVDWFSSYRPQNAQLLRESFTQQHIPGAQLVSIQVDLSEPMESTISEAHPNGLPFTRVSDPELMSAMVARLGLRSIHDQVVLYSRPIPTLQPPSSITVAMMGATRAWWVLHSWGFSNVWVLNGGLTSWCESGLPLEAGESSRAHPGEFESAWLQDKGSCFKATANDVQEAIQVLDSLRD